MAKHHSALDMVVLVLLILGALDLGLMALNMNIIPSLLGHGTMLARIIYGLIGLAGLYAITWLFKKP